MIRVWLILHQLTNYGHKTAIFSEVLPGVATMPKPLEFLITLFTTLVKAGAKNENRSKMII